MFEYTKMLQQAWLLAIGICNARIRAGETPALSKEVKITGDERSGKTGGESRTEHLTSSERAAFIPGYFRS
jgi:hypothetical protein